MSKTKNELFSWIKSIIIAFGIVMLVKTFLFAPYIVKGSSMEPTLHNHEKILVNKLGAITDGLSRGDIVIIKDTKEDTNYVKRIIGFPGERIEMKEDKLYVNKEQVDESYLTANRNKAEELGVNLTGDIGPIIVPENHYYVMGDNRLNSMDSRNGLGFIHKDYIIGESEFVFYPLSKIRDIK
ncbi:signal peptidase I [Pseudalkalibacillus berkeleyi]|uniref:Signal peptidase I n=1 Tax=Pseudalkalibacillus berkeleyi TaxID=1069813 RepID=A0ABS9H171_9BACL|nr:signal peptidase I [Pseudalkalibacillus berkeleyi]MCF6137685.1 signal peptidase I [Pseudalkalibacillus berkeleyi]